MHMCVHMCVPGIACCGRRQPTRCKCRDVYRYASTDVGYGTIGQPSSKKNTDMHISLSRSMSMRMFIHMSIHMCVPVIAVIVQMLHFIDLLIDEAQLLQ